MKKVFDILKKDIWFHIFAGVSVFLIVTSFFIPPHGVIDSSVFVGVGELFGFAALWQLTKAIDKGVDAKITHHDTTIEVGDLNKKNKDEE